MRRDDYRPFAQEMARLSEIFSEECSALRVTAYFEALEGYSLLSVVNAMRRAVKNSKFFPRPAEILVLLEEPDLPIANALPAHVEPVDEARVKALLADLHGKLTGPREFEPSRAFPLKRPEPVELSLEERAERAEDQIARYRKWCDDNGYSVTREPAP